MTNALIICTFKRPQAVLNLIDSIVVQTKVPFEIIIVDGSNDDETNRRITERSYLLNIRYYLVEKEHRGLTKQRNFGVSKVSGDVEIVSFLDDDIVLEPNYFEEIEKTFNNYPEAVGIGGIDLQENRYFKKNPKIIYPKFNFFEIDGWVAKETLRFKARNFFGLLTDLQPDIIPDFSHGRSGLPPNGQVYLVEHFMGGIANYKKGLFDHINFSSYFEGYGLYEDFDFCVRSLPHGKLYINTNAQVWHLHEPAGRPNTFKYGNMVVRNGWYVWRLRFPKPTLKARIKWILTVLLLALIRLSNTVTGPNRKDSFLEFCGRINGLIKLIYDRPAIIK